MKNGFTSMLLSEKFGKHYSVQMGFMGLVTIAVLGISMLCVSILAIYGYVSDRNEKASLALQISTLESDIEALQQETREAAFYKEWADRIIFRRMHFEDLAGRGNLVAENLLSGEIPLAGVASSSARLDVDEFEVRRLNLALDFEFSFNLINLSKGRQKLCGYLVVAASNEDVIPPVYNTSSMVSAQDGMLPDYQQGKRFSIYYLKKIAGKINQPNVGVKYNRLTIMAYSEDGKLLMKKGFFIERMLQVNPFG